MDADGEVYLLNYSGADSEVVIPEGVTAIYENAFGEHVNVEKVIFASTVKEIMPYAFYYSNVKEVVLNEGLETIGDDAFYYSALQKINALPSTLVEIAQEAFYGSDLTGSIAIPETVTTIGKYAFRATGDITILVTLASKPSGWNDYWARMDYYNDHMVLWGFTGEAITYTFMNGDEVLSTITDGMPIAIPEGPVVEGYIFAGWYDNAEFIGSALSGSYYNGVKTTLYAKFVSEEIFQGGSSMDDPRMTLSGFTYDVHIENAGDQLYFVITVEAGEKWNVTTSGDGDHKLWYYDADGNQIKTRDSSYAENYDYTFSEAGTYYIGIGYYSSSKTGDFYVTLTKL